jgi:hypothetical protein
MGFSISIEFIKDFIASKVYKLKRYIAAVNDATCFDKMQLEFSQSI